MGFSSHTLLMNLLTILYGATELGVNSQNKKCQNKAKTRRLVPYHIQIANNDGLFLQA